MKKQRLKKLWSSLKSEVVSRRSPHQVALGIGIGAFIGVFPVQGFKTLLVFLIASLYKRVNIISIFAASTIFSLPFTFPFVYFFDYLVGCWILGIPSVFTLGSFRDFNLKMLGESIGALFLGGAVVGVFLGIFTYFVTFFAIKLKLSK